MRKEDLPEWEDDQENGLLVNVPAEEERGVSTQCHRTDEVIVCRFEE